MGKAGIADPVKDYDVIVVGSGIGGPTAASKPHDSRTDPRQVLAKLKVEVPRGSKRADLVELYDNAVSTNDDSGNPE